MADTVAYNYTTRLDKVVERGILTADLSMNQDMLGEYRGKGVIEIPDIVMDGLGTYSRTNGFPAGSITFNWEQYQMQYDRGREFEIDNMDDEERAMIISANLMAEFARTKVIPEVDAIRFAKLHQAAGQAATPAAISTAAAAVKAVELAEEYMEDMGVELNRCVLYCTSAIKGLLKEGQPYRIGQGEAPNRTFQTFDEMKIVTVPSARFYNKIDLLSGGSGETAGGYKKATTGGVGLNFMVVDPGAVAALQKHETMRHFAPEVNQSKDAHKWQYRLYHDLIVPKNQKARVYTCASTS